jgi:CxxC motif-containing protein (DUF1111 family)
MAQRTHIPILVLTLVGAAACTDDAPTAAATDPVDAAVETDAAPPRGGFGSGLGRPLSFMTRDQQLLFLRGRAVFQRVFTPATGLGPLFNSSSCASCHGMPVTGGGGLQIETHQSAWDGASCNDLEDIGGQVIQDSTTPAMQALGVFKEPELAEATGTGHRLSPSLLGFGLLEAVPDAQILARADPNDLNHDGISGRPGVAESGALGRFGKKATAATLEEFSSGAFIYEMGITNADEPDEQTIHGNPLPVGADPTPDLELSQQDFDAAVAFVRYLSPPQSWGFRFARFRGQRLFQQVGCAACHTPALYTGHNADRARSNRVVYAYTDLLLHDMGPALADICLGGAEPSEFRTEPLMGIQFRARYLHDGRAATIDQAIRMHDGEGARARDRYTTLAPQLRATLVQFVSSL